MVTDLVLENDRSSLLVLINFLGQEIKKKMRGTLVE